MRKACSGVDRRGSRGASARSRDIITVVTERLRKNETTFLHPLGVDEECDEARNSLS